MKALLALTFFVLLAGCSRHAEQTSNHTNRAGAAASRQAQSADTRSVIYPYSIVPGGVRTREDVRAAMTGDALTAEHYSGVAVASLEPVTLRRDTKAYVSFRKRGKIYWTRNPVLIPAGEKVLSNGIDCLRGRCGNRISFKPQEPVIEEADREPTSEMFNTPQAGGVILDEVVPPLPMRAFAQPAHMPAPEIPAASVVTTPGATSGEAAPPSSGRMPGMPAIPTPPYTPATATPPVEPIFFATNPGPGVPVAQPVFGPPPGFVAGSYHATTPVMTMSTIIPPQMAPVSTPTGTPVMSSYSPIPPDTTPSTPPSSPTSRPPTTTSDEPCRSTPNPPPGTPPSMPPPSTPPPSTPPPSTPPVLPPFTPPEVPQDVPEPATSLLVAGAIAILGLWRALRRDA